MLPRDDELTDETQQRDRFFMLYGQAISAWSAVEGALCLWFIYSCDPDDPYSNVLRSVFYSARSFSGSLSMLTAAFDANKYRRQEMKEFFAEAEKKTLSYSRFRNALAHDHTTYNLNSGRYELRSAGNSLSDKTIYVAENIETGRDNFIFLRDIWLDVLPILNDEPLSPLEGLERVLALPSQAHSRELSLKQQGRQYQRGLKPRQKKRSQD